MKTTSFFRRTAGFFAALVLASCFGDSTGPGSVHRVSLSLAPQLDPAAARLVNFDSVHVVLTRPSDNSIALDTTVFFPANVDTLTLSLQVLVQGATEQFTLNMDLIDNVTHSVVFHAGPVPVTASTSGSNPPATPILAYVGPGSNAAGVRFVGAQPGSAFFQDTATFVAEAFDGQGVTMPNVPIKWISSDTLKAKPIAALPGRFAAGLIRGSATITAQLLTAKPPVTSALAIQPKPIVLLVQGGNNQTAPVGSALAQPVTARVNAADGLGVQGVVVTFAVTAGGGTLSQLKDTTDASGDAAVTWTLGGSLGAQSVSATAAGIAPVISFASTASVGPPKKLGYTVGPSSITTGQPITPAVRVAAQDSFGNTVTTYTGNITVALGANPGAATLSGTLTVAAVAGIATFSNLSLSAPSNGYTLVATAAGLTSVTSGTFNATGGVPTQVAFAVQPTASAAGSAIAPAVKVEIRDALNNLVTNATGTVTIAIGANPGGGTLSGTVSAAAVGGVATFSTLSIDKPGTGYALTAASAGLTGATSATFDVSSGPATTLFFTTQPPLTQTAGVTMTVIVTAKDALGNTAPSFTGPVTVAFGANPGGATLSGTLTINAVNGVASFSTISVDRAGTGYTLVATSAGLGAATSNAFDVGPSSPSQISFAQQPTATEAGLAFTPTFQLVVKDGFGNVVTSYVDTITVTLSTNPTGDVLLGTTKVLTSAGAASFTNLRLRKAGGGYVVFASAPGLTGVNSAAFAINAGPPSKLKITAQPPASVTAGAAIPLTATASDSLGNVASGYAGSITLGLAANPGADAVQGTASVAASGGVATFSAAFLRFAASGYTLTVTGAGLAPDTSTALSVGAAAATALQFGTQPPTTAIFQSPFLVSAIAKDAFGNTATSFGGAVTVGIGANPASGSLYGTTTASATAGVVSFAGISIDNIGAAYTLTANATGLAGTASNPLNVIAPANANAWINVAGGTWSTASNWSKGTVPNAVDTVFIRQSGTYTVTVDVPTAAIARLDVGGLAGQQTLTLGPNLLTMAGNGAFSTRGHLIVGAGQVTGPGIVDVFGSFDWTGGNIANGAGTIRVQPGATATISGAAARQLVAYTLEIGGIGTWSGSQTIQTGTAGTIRVLPTGTLDIQGDPTFLNNLGGAPSVFQNQGTVNRTTSTGPVTITAQVDNDGILNVNTGLFESDQGSASADGAWNVASGAILKFNGAATQILGAAGSVSGAGDVQLTVGTVTASGGWNVTGQTVINGGTFNYNGASGSTAAVGLSSGTMGGSGLMNISTILAWSGGNFTGTGGTARVLAGGALNINGNTLRNLVNYNVEVAGTGTWSGTQTIQSGTSGALRVLSGGTLDLQSDPTFVNNLGGAPSVLDNQGTFTRSTSLGIATISAAFNNTSGSTSVTSGSLRLGNGGTSNAPFAVSAGATLEFSGLTHNLGASAGVSGAGSVVVSGATVNAAGSWGVTGTTQVTAGALNYNAAAGSTANLAVSGGTLGGSAAGVFTVGTAMTWSGGNLQGAGGKVVVPSGATLAISGAATRNFTNYTLEIGGAGTWTGTNVIQTGSLGIIRVLPGATLDIQGDGSYSNVLGGTASRLEVKGTLTRTVSAGNATITAEVDNDGQITETTGRLKLGGGSGAGTSDGIYTASGSGILEYNGGIHTLGAASTGNGNGQHEFSAGTVTTLGTWAVTGTSQVFGGRFDYNNATAGNIGTLIISNGFLGGSGVLQVNGTLTWSGGDLSGTGGKVRVQGSATMAIINTATRNMTNYSLELNSTAGTWSASSIIQSGSGAAFRILPAGTLAISADPTFTNNLGGAPTTFENQGTLNRTTSAGVVTISAAFNNTGTANISTGSVAVNSGGTLANTIALTGSGIMVLNGGAFTMAPNLLVSGTNPLNVNAGSLVGLPGATDTVRIFNLALNGGALGNAVGTIKITGAAAWNSGSMNGGGKLLIPSGSSLTIAGALSRTMTNYTIENAGTAASISGAMTIQSGSGAVIRNLPTGTFLVTAGATYDYNLGGASSLFDNQGLLQVNPGAAAVFRVTAPFRNTGASGVQIPTGTLLLQGGGFQSAPVNVAGTLDFGTGTDTLNNGFTTSGTGVAQVSAGTLTNSAVSDTARFVNLNVNGGTLNQVGGIIVVGGTLNWAGGNITGTGTVAGNNVTNFTGTLGRNFQNGIIENRGNLAWSGNFTMSTGNGAVLQNSAGSGFTWTADANMAFNLGGALSTFVNKGSLTVNTGSPALAARIGAAFVDTTGSLLSVVSGDLMLSNGGRIGGAPSIASGAFLEVIGGTLSLKGGLAISGTGNLRVNGGTVTVDSSLTASVGGLELLAGTINHKGILNVGAAMTWTSGTLSSNLVGTGAGITRVGTSATLVINGVTAHTLTGPHTLDILSGPTANFSANTVQSGNGAVIQNARTIDWQGTATIAYNLGGTQTILRNLAGGVLSHSTGGTGTTGAFLDNSGALNVVTGTLQFTGGSSTNFKGTAAVSAGALLDFSGGTFTQNGLFAVTGDLASSGGAITPNGNTLTVSGNFTTSGSGNLTMTNNLDSVDIVGNATFGGGASTMNAGVIRITGNFAQTGSGNFKGTAQSAALAHRVRLAGGNSTISFADPLNDFFRRLLVSSNAGTARTMTTDVKTTFFSLGGGTYGFNGSNPGLITRLTADTVAGASSGSVSMGSPMVLVVNAALVDSNIINVDTVIFAGSGQNILSTAPGGAFGNYTYQSIRVAQTAGTATVAVPTTLNLTKDLVVSSGTLNLAGRHVGVTGNFRTENTGVLQMIAANDSLGVAGSANFSGGSTAGLLTNGLISLKGDFTQGGASSTAYTPSTAHKIRFDASNVLQRVTFQNPTLSFFDSVVVDKGVGISSAVQLQTDAQVTRGMLMQNSSNLTSLTTQKLSIGGVLRMVNSTTHPTITPFVLQLSTFPNIDSIFAVVINPDTLVFAGGITSLPTGSTIAYKSIRVATTGTLGYTFGAPLTLANDLVVSAGTFSMGANQSVTATGRLVTQGAGVLNMTTANAVLQVNGAATFGGGSTNGQLTAGLIRFRGNFTQSGGSAAAFSATLNHQSEFSGTSQQTVNMVNSGIGAAASHFGQLRMTRAGGIVKLLVQSNLNAGLIADTSLGFNDSIIGTGFTTVTADSVQLINTVFNNMPLVLSANNAFISVNTLRFENMDPTITQFTVNRTALGSSSISGLTFQTPPTTGKYFALSSTVPTWTLTVTTGSPAAGLISTLYNRTNSIVIWNGLTNP